MFFCQTLLTFRIFFLNFFGIQNYSDIFLGLFWFIGFLNFLALFFLFTTYWLSEFINIFLAFWITWKFFFSWYIIIFNLIIWQFFCAYSDFFKLLFGILNLLELFLYSQFLDFLNFFCILIVSPNLIGFQIYFMKFDQLPEFCFLQNMLIQLSQFISAFWFYLKVNWLSDVFSKSLGNG